MTDVLNIVSAVFSLNATILLWRRTRKFSCLILRLLVGTLVQVVIRFVYVKDMEGNEGRAWKMTCFMF